MPTYNPVNDPQFWPRVHSLMSGGMSSSTAYETVWNELMTLSGNQAIVEDVDVDWLDDPIISTPVSPQPVPPVQTFTTGWATTNVESTNSTQFSGFFTSSPPPAVKKTKKGPIQDVSNEEKSKMVLQQLYLYPNLNIQKNVCVEYEKTHQIKDKPFEFITNHGMIGIEVEVENITNSVPVAAYWSAQTDGSLRNHGMEFVTVPMQVKQVQLAVEHLFDALKNNKYDFSNRTSIHIHLNCRDMTQDQVYTMVLLYAIFEKYFYSFAGQKRLNSIFCVPLFRCNMIRNIKDVVYGFIPQWHKYCGINLLPLLDHDGKRAYGTIEFRHLYGTDNKQEIYEWINTILALRHAALNTITKEELFKEIESMNTSSSYLHLFARVFPNTKMRSDGKEFEECISNIKREIWRGDYLNTLKKSDVSDYWKTIEKLGVRG